MPPLEPRMSLLDYRRKRRFDQTREPPGRVAAKGRRAIFVVQLHHASRRHYDFRLQVGDTLKSWAVPKGPSYDPTVKRMAVEVEDHPLDYADFEGEIPQGQYGGGHVARFDHGIWTTREDPAEQLANGHLRFELFGDKLKGGWHLVRSGKAARQPHWLLFKDRDAFAGDLEADDLLGGVVPAPESDRRRAGGGKRDSRRLARVPAQRVRRRDWAGRALSLRAARKAKLPPGPFQPQLATLAQSPPGDGQWLHEIKWDGYRILVTITGGDVRLWSRNALEWTDKLPDIRDALEGLGLDSAALDGELIAGRGSRDDFNLLQATLAGQRQHPLALVLFDVLHLEGVEVAGAPLLERKALLQELLDGAPPQLAFSSHVDVEGAVAFRTATGQGFEGVISKRRDRPYHAGRSDDWRKSRHLASDEFAVVGFTAPKGSRTGFGSLLLALPDRRHGWRYAGRVGTGFDEATLRQLSRRLRGGRDTPSVHIGNLETDLRTARWFAPRFVVEVSYRGKGGQALLRQPSLKAVRLDKNVDDLRNDREASPEKPASATASHKRAANPMADALPALSSPDKLLYPAGRISKQDVWNYYLAVADHLLPQIAGRPLSVVRCPDGIQRACFFQKHVTAGLERVSTVRLKEESGARADYLVVDDLAGLMELVQFNALEFHPWGARADTPDSADRLVFDLDPGPGVPFADVKRAATRIRRLLAEMELECFLRVSGGKGLHVVVPLAAGCDWGLARRFAHGFADALAQSEPDRFVATATKSRRNRRIFVDYLRNGRGATAVASYSLRARAGAPVALPLAWSELGKLHRADAFTIAEVPAKLRRRRKDPWAGMDALEQHLPRFDGEP